jgi:hypothetical protein
MAFVLLLAVLLRPSAPPGPGAPPGPSAPPGPGAPPDAPWPPREISLRGALRNIALASSMPPTHPRSTTAPAMPHAPVPDTPSNTPLAMPPAKPRASSSRSASPAPWASPEPPARPRGTKGEGVLHPRPRGTTAPTATLGAIPAAPLRRGRTSRARSLTRGAWARRAEWHPAGLPSCEVKREPPPCRSPRLGRSFRRAPAHRVSSCRFA